MNNKGGLFSQWVSQVTKPTDIEAAADDLEWRDLMAACAAGNSAEVSGLVQVPGLDINYQNNNGEPAAVCSTLQRRVV